MSGDFIDSNIFVYMYDATNPVKQRAAREFVGMPISSGAASVSFQVVQETLNVLTRKLPMPMTVGDARRFLDEVLVPLWRVMPTQSLYVRALDIQARYQYAFNDALIIAAALSAGCTRLLSEDLRHGQRVEGLTIENPFLP